MPQRKRERLVIVEGARRAPPRPRLIAAKDAAGSAVLPAANPRARMPT